MQITRNTTSMAAGICVSTDKAGRDFCVVVVKGTFSLRSDGGVELADEQAPLVYADEHYGEPAETSIRYECDFVPFKPRCDVLMNGSAHAPGGKSATRVTVALRVGSVNKSFDVVGDRVWRRGIVGLVPTRPKAFRQLPITYDRAYGGVDVAGSKSEKTQTFLENPVGTGYYPLTRRAACVGKPLANTEETGRPIRSASRRYRPMSFGAMGRNFPSRVRFAGTYDDHWKEDRFPFLPLDFDEQYFLCSPPDQQAPFLRGGEVVSMKNLTPEGQRSFTVPRVDVPIVCRFRDRDDRPSVRLDTMIIEPDQGRVILTWRARTQLGRKIHALREILIGRRPRARASKPRFRSIPEFIEWKRQRAPIRSE